MRGLTADWAILAEDGRLLTRSLLGSCCEDPCGTVLEEARIRAEALPETTPGFKGREK